MFLMLDNVSGYKVFDCTLCLFPTNQVNEPVIIFYLIICKGNDNLTFFFASDVVVIFRMCPKTVAAEFNIFYRPIWAMLASP